MTKDPDKRNDQTRPDQEPEAAPEPTPVTLSPAEFEELLRKSQETEAFLEMAKRAKADFANYQKRVQRDAARAAEDATADIARSLLPVLDNLGRAIDAAEEEHDFPALLQGIKLVNEEMLKTLSTFGIEPIEARGAIFDPSRHEAVFSEATSEAEPHTVLDELHRGFLYKDRLLRPAAVKVAVAPPDTAEGAADSEPNDED